MGRPFAADHWVYAATPDAMSFRALRFGTTGQASFLYATSRFGVMVQSAAQDMQRTPCNQADLAM